VPRAVTEAFFLARPEGRRFCVLRSPDSAPKGSLLFVHPFAEELNKSRRAVAETARVLARAGWAVLTLDLLGCGDSSGDFADATWEDWIDDVMAGSEWLAIRFGCYPDLWGLRAGCLIIAGCLSRLGRTPNLIFWQPTLSGRAHLQQFLRLRSLGAIAGVTDKVGTEVLTQQLEAGESLEIAGYELSPTLALQMAEAQIAVPERYEGQIHWFEISTATPTLSPAGTRCVDALRQAGARVVTTVLEGLPFWQTQEIAECPALAEATVRALGPAAV